MIALLALSVALADCPAPVSAAELDARVEDVMAAFRALDDGALQDTTLAFEGALPCLKEPLTPALAARWHAAAALTAIGRQDPVATADALRAAAFSEARQEAADVLSVSVRAEELFHQSALERPPRRKPVPVPEGETLWVDGSTNQHLCRDTQAVLQRRAAEGAPLQTALWTGDRPPMCWRELFVDEPSRRGPAPRRGALAGGAGAAALVAGVVYGVGLANQAIFQDPETPLDDLPALQARSHRLTWTAAGAGAAALGLGAALVITW